MSQKPEYYNVLGIQKGATADEIKTAYTKAAMRNHPDRFINKSDAEKEAARLKFQDIEEAYSVLRDDSKRATYDSYGHEGLARQAAGQSAGTGRSFTDLAGPGSKPRHVSEEDAFSFFDRAAGNNASAPSSSDAPPVDRNDAAAARRARREERRGTGAPGIVEAVTVKTPVADPIGQPAKPAKPAEAPKAKTATGFDFKGASSDLRSAQEKIGEIGRGEMAEVPVEILERFRDNMRETLNVLDAAITRAKRGGPRR